MDFDTLASSLTALTYRFAVFISEMRLLPQPLYLWAGGVQMPTEQRKQRDERPQEQQEQSEQPEQLEQEQEQEQQQRQQRQQQQRLAPQHCTITFIPSQPSSITFIWPSYGIASRRGIYLELINRVPDDYYIVTPHPYTSWREGGCLEIREYDDEICPICYDDYAMGEIIAMLPCGHPAHDLCLQMRWQTRMSCARCTREWEWRLVEKRRDSLDES